jgi:cobyrinic acid a,c-diamide synthase
MAMNVPRLVVAGLSGDAGKTVVGLSLVSAFRRRGLAVSVFKKGPDYIDAAWQSWAAGVPCRNLDTFMADAAVVRDAFISSAAGSDVAVVEGNRGLFDGSDAQGTHSTAVLARLLKAPIVLVVSCTKTTRTIAAVVHGCQTFEPDLKIVGVVLNRIAGTRHQSVVTEAITQYCALPVLGAIPKLGDDSRMIPGRHLGLITPSEFSQAESLSERLRQIADEHLDIERLLELARGAEALDEPRAKHKPAESSPVRVGYFRDPVFTFYYPENLEALERNGAELIPIASLDAPSLPAIDALYIGGGFPEVHAERLSQNRSLMDGVRQASAKGLPIYAECGGLIYLSRSVEYNGRRHPMAGLFDVDLRLQAKPAGHGYATVRVDSPCPYFDENTEITGHEFHYSQTINPVTPSQTCMAVTRGVGLGNGRDGLLRDNTLACYTHLHALGVQAWAASLTARAREYRQKQKENTASSGVRRDRGMALAACAVR